MALRLMARQLVRSVPFITPRTFLGAFNNGTAVTATFDTLDGFADPALFNTVLGFPDVNTAVPWVAGGLTGTAMIRAVGPSLDAFIWSSVAVLVRVQYAADRGCLFRPIAPDTAIPANTPENISGLRITGRFVAVSLINNSGANGTVEFGVYVRSA